MLSLQLDNKSLLRLPDRDRKRSREVQAWDGTSIEDPLADPALSSSPSRALGFSSGSFLGRFPSPLTKTGVPATTHRDPHLSSGPLSRHARSPPPSTQPQPLPACSTPLDFRAPSHSPWQRHQPSCSKPLLHFASPSPSPSPSSNLLSTDSFLISSPSSSDVFSDSFFFEEPCPSTSAPMSYSDSVFQHQTFDPHEVLEELSPLSPVVCSNGRASSSAPPLPLPRSTTGAISVETGLADDLFSERMRVLSLHRHAVEKNIRNLRKVAKRSQRSNIKAHTAYWGALQQQLEKVQQEELDLERRKREIALDAEKRRVAQLKLEQQRARLAQPFPRFSAAEEKQIATALNPRGPTQEILVSAYNIDIKREDILRLSDCKLLNDEIINFYFQLVTEVATCRVYAFNTFFFPLLKNGYRRVQNWTRRIDLFSFDKIIIPIHLSLHWCLAVLNIRDQRIEYYDSLNGRDPCSALFKDYLETEYQSKKNQPIDLSSWQAIQYLDIPQQNNGYDCGVFACQFARCASQDKPFSFKQADMPYLRNRMVVEIVQRKITTV